jgi:predicted secreted Zn-dependent protease
MKIMWGTLLALAFACQPAGAATEHSIHYSAYPVNGKTPAEIYRMIMNRGPMVSGNRAIAATTSEAVQSHILTQGTASCQVTSFRLNFRFDVQLPRHANPTALSPRDRFLWQQFSGFLKAHELQHTRLWLRCGTSLERQVMAIRASSCAEVERKAEAIWRRMKPICDREQVNFDKGQRSQLMVQPFMQKVIRGD